MILNCQEKPKSDYILQVRLLKSLGQIFFSYFVTLESQFFEEKKQIVFLGSKSTKLQMRRMVERQKKNFFLLCGQMTISRKREKAREREKLRLRKRREAN